MFVRFRDLFVTFVNNHELSYAPKSYPQAIFDIIHEKNKTIATKTHRLEYGLSLLRSSIALDVPDCILICLRLIFISANCFWL